MVLVPPLGGRSLPLAGNGVGRAGHPMRRLQRNQQTGNETAPQQEQNLPAETTEAVLITTRNGLYGKDYPHVQEVRARLPRVGP